MRKAFINELICILFGSILLGVIFFIIGNPIIHGMANIEYYYWLWDGLSFIWLGFCLQLCVVWSMIFIKGMKDA